MDRLFSIPIWLFWNNQKLPSSIKNFPKEGSKFCRIQCSSVKNCRGLKFGQSVKFRQIWSHCSAHSNKISIECYNLKEDFKLESFHLVLHVENDWGKWRQKIWSESTQNFQTEWLNVTFEWRYLSSWSSIKW